MKHLLNKRNAVLLVLLCLLAGYVNAAVVSCQTNVVKQKLINISQSQVEEQVPQATTKNTLGMTNEKTEKKAIKQSKFGDMFELLVPARLRKL